MLPWSVYPTMAVTREKYQLMSASEIDRTLVRLAHEILERTEDLDKLAFIGIRRRGVPLADRSPPYQLYAHWPNFHCNEANIVAKVSARRESLHLFDDLMTQLKSGQFTASIHSFKQAPIVIDVSAGSLNFK